MVAVEVSFDFVHLEHENRSMEYDVWQNGEKEIRISITCKIYGRFIFAMKIYCGDWKGVLAAGWLLTIACRSVYLHKII